MGVYGIIHGIWKDENKHVYRGRVSSYIPIKRLWHLIYFRGLS